MKPGNIISCCALLHRLILIMPLRNERKHITNSRIYFFCYAKRCMKLARCKKSSATNCSHSNSYSSGFSLIEVLVVVAILAILLVLAMFFIQRHLMRARDAQRKSDLDRIRTAFEVYYNDHRCYPDPYHLLDCGSSSLSPYLPIIPCDPLTKEGYFYQGLGDSYCGGYRILAKLEIDVDTDIAAVGCDSIDGCGGEGGQDYNWGVSMGVPVGDANADWQTGDQEAYFCTPLHGAGGPYECDNISYSERIEYFFGCRGYETYENCSADCIETTPIPDGTACVCKYGADYPGCQ